MEYVLHSVTAFPGSWFRMRKVNLNLPQQIYTLGFAEVRKCIQSCRDKDDQTEVFICLNSACGLNPVVYPGDEGRCYPVRGYFF